MEGYISALTVVIIYFLGARTLSEAESREVTKRAIRGFNIVSMSEDVIKKALGENRIKDLEDAIQFHSAKEVADVLITRNKRDFRAVEDEEIEVLTPEEFLEKYKA
ncbi:PIN domain protein [Thermofilum pendens Hrk 5]|uniref:PIN domain protein n=1 Tax=Thermofilum pendens (strain DSM 2475 / Hrk 5) TaxID=368408 RepID=A1RYU8_THEPD|nr:PIN domain protein [Thermofilum pendens Hrk 5]